MAERTMEPGRVRRTSVRPVGSPWIGRREMIRIAMTLAAVFALLQPAAAQTFLPAPPPRDMGRVGQPDQSGL